MGWGTSSWDSATSSSGWATFSWARATSAPAWASKTSCGSPSWCWAAATWCGSASPSWWPGTWSCFFGMSLLAGTSCTCKMSLSACPGCPSLATACNFYQGCASCQGTACVPGCAFCLAKTASFQGSCAFQESWFACARECESCGGPGTSSFQGFWSCASPATFSGEFGGEGSFCARGCGSAWAGSSCGPKTVGDKATWVCRGSRCGRGRRPAEEDLVTLPEIPLCACSRGQSGGRK